MARLDPHSYNDDVQPAASRIHWKARVDFDARVLDGEATHFFEAPVGGPLDLDTRDLDVTAVLAESGEPLPFVLHPPEPVLGSRLRVEMPAGTTALRIRYRTSPHASALQWLEPAQTFGGTHPFLFSQCQAIHARSVLPLQDTPRLRLRYRAELTVPRALKALMAAAFVERVEADEAAVERWEMPQPIPPYLFAFAVGDLTSRELGPRSRVWAEPSVVEAAAWEFADVDRMLATAESLFGPYDWERFDLLLMPKSFPYGGMENPRLTFLTPTLLAGDRSLVSVVAHELAHSWTGNLVSNASAEHFWLNEGFTVFAERRIQEALEGPDARALHDAIGRRDLERAIEDFADRPELTRLRTRMEGVDPDDGYSTVPYEKGCLFLRRLEAHAGRAAFDRMLRSWLAAHRFGSVTTEDFEAHLERELPGALAAVQGDVWLRGTGLPADAPAAESTLLAAVERVDARIPTAEEAAGWLPAQWQLYLERLPRPAPDGLCAALDERFRLTESGNYEVLAAWLELAVESEHAPVLARVEQVLEDVGRMKYLKPLYKALARHAPTRAMARGCFERLSPRYHPIARQVVGALLDREAPVVVR